MVSGLTGENSDAVRVSRNPDVEALIMELQIVMSKQIQPRTNKKSSSRTYSWIIFVVMKSMLNPLCIFVCGFFSLNRKDFLNPNALLK